MEMNFSKASRSLYGDSDENIHFATEIKLSDGKKNQFTPERVLKVEGKVFDSQHINGSRKSN